MSWLNDGSAKPILPRYGYLILPGRTISMSKFWSFGSTTSPLSDCSLKFRHLVLRDAEVHPDRIQRGNVGEIRAFRRGVDVRALPLQRAAGKPGDGRGDGRVAQVELRVLDLGIGRKDCCSGGVELALRLVEIRLRQCVLLGQRLDARIRGLRGNKPRLLRLQLALGAIQLRVERLGIEHEHDLALLDELALFVADAIQEAGDARDDVDLPRALGLGHEHGRVRNRRRRDGQHADLRRGTRWRGRFLPHAATQATSAMARTSAGRPSDGKGDGERDVMWEPREAVIGMNTGCDGRCSV